MSSTVDLPDLNVWLALACPDHSYHHQALHYWEQQVAQHNPAAHHKDAQKQPKQQPKATRRLGSTLQGAHQQQRQAH